MLPLKIPSLITINGQQGSGKSQIIRYIMYTYQRVLDIGVVFTNTYFTDDSYDFVPKRRVHPLYDEKVLEKLMDIQMTRKGYAYVIFDDCLHGERQWSSKVLSRLVTQIRHYRILMIITTQYPVKIPSSIRDLSFNAIIFEGFGHENAMKALYDYTREVKRRSKNGDQFTTLRKFMTFMDRLPKHSFLFIHDGDSEVYIGPPTIPKFQVGGSMGKPSIRNGVPCNKTLWFYKEIEKLLSN